MGTEGINARDVARNPCKLCSPLGACLALRGVRDSMAVIHGSQGCATYIRRYLIGHFREPVDIASSSFSDRTAIFGGAAALGTALDNVVRQYRPRMVGVTTSCLSETIGDDVSLILREHAAERSGEDSPGLVHVSTPSYRGTHVDGFHAAVTAVVDAYARGGERGRGVAVFPGMVSPADTRHLKEILDDCGVAHAILPDYSESLDGGAWQSFERIPGGGTSLEDVAGMGPR